MTETINPNLEDRVPIIGEAGKLRLIAFILDNLIGWGSAILVAKLFLSENVFLNAGLLCFGYLVYFIVFEAFFSATIGKYLLGIEIRMIDGARCGLLAVLLRNVMRLIDSNPVLFGSYPAGFAILVSKRRQRFGDMLAGTIVVRREILRTN